MTNENNSKGDPCFFNRTYCVMGLHAVTWIHVSNLEGLCFFCTVIAGIVEVEAFKILTSPQSDDSWKDNRKTDSGIPPER